MSELSVINTIKLSTEMVESFILVIRCVYLSKTHSIQSREKKSCYN